jgi:hypothetical protein
MKNQTAKNKNVFLVLGLVVLTLVGFVGLRLTVWKTKPQKQYQRFYIDNQASPYTANKDFYLSGEIQVSAPADNYVFKSAQLFDFSKIQDAALKLGLSKLSKNEVKKIYLWSTDPYNAQKNIKLDLQQGIIEVRFETGISAKKVDSASAFTEMSEFLSFDTDLTGELVDNISSGPLDLLTYSIKFNDTASYISPATDLPVKITLLNEQIIGFQTPILMKDFKPEREIKPVTAITAKELPGLNYFIDFKPTTTSSISSLGGEASVQLPVQVNMKAYQNVYYYYFDDIANTVIYLPAIEVKGNYLDNKNNSGSFTLLVVNQAYDPNIK